jgi:hypothetical protein
LTEAAQGFEIITYNMKKGTNYSTTVNFADTENNLTAPKFKNFIKEIGTLDTH